MWRNMAVLLVLVGGTVAAGYAGLFQRVTVVQMETKECVHPGHSILAALAGNEPGLPRSICAEYVLVSPSIVFRVQASRRAPLLLPGEEVSFRPGKGSLRIRRDDQSGEFDVSVLCMWLRGRGHDSCAEVGEEVVRVADR